MAKEGLNHHVAQHPDPTYEAVLHNVRQEAKEKRKEASQKGFRCICSIRKYIRENGFELADHLWNIRGGHCGYLHIVLVFRECQMEG